VLDLNGITESLRKTEASRVGDFFVETEFDPAFNQLSPVQRVESAEVSDHTRRTENISCQTLVHLAELLRLLLPAAFLSTKKFDQLLCFVETVDAIGNGCFKT